LPAECGHLCRWRPHLERTARRGHIRRPPGLLSRNHPGAGRELCRCLAAAIAGRGARCALGALQPRLGDGPKTLRPEEFHPDKFERGQKHALDLDLGAAAGGVNLPVLLARGSRTGKRLVTTAAVHGDEYEGVRAIFDVWQALDPAALTGDWLAVPVANPPAFWSGTRTSPLDQANLARVFPGSLEGGPSATLA